VSGNAVVGRLRLASDLRRLRHAAGLTLEDVARGLECSPAKVSRMETGAVGVRLQDVRAIGELLRLDEAERELMTTLVREARTRGWWQEFADVVPADSAIFYGLEDGADLIAQHTLALVPGLLQTEAYARALLESASGVSAETVDRRLALRMRRQAVLDRPSPPKLDLFLDEAVLHRVVGGHEVMAEQLAHLLALADRSTVDLRIVPFAAGVHSAAGVGFTVFAFDDAAVTPVVFAEQLSRNVFIDELDEVDVYRQSLVDATRVASTPYDSRRLVADRLAAIW